MRFDDPVTLFHEAIAAYRARQVHRFGDCFDPVSLARMRREVLESLTRPTHVPTVEDFMRDGKMPREVAEYHAAQAGASSSQSARLRQEFPQVESVAQLERMTPGELFFHFVDGHSVPRQIERLIDEGRIPKRPEGESFPEPVPEAVGYVVDGPVAIVLFRDRLQDLSRTEWITEQPEAEREFVHEVGRRGHPHTVACYRQPDGGWKLVADHGFLYRGGVFISSGETGP